MRYPDSGLYHYCLNLGLHVKEELEKSGEGRISFYVPPAESKSFGKNASCIVERKWYPSFFKSYLWECDIWHAPFQSGRVLPVNKPQVKVLLTIHDLNCLHEGRSRKEQAESLKKTQRLINHSHALVCISEHSKNDVLTNLDVGKRPVFVVHNGTHHVAAPPAEPTGYKPSRPFVFGMGYMNRKKNFHTLIPLLADEMIELVIAGKIDDPDYANNMKRMAKSMGVADRLHIAGPVPEPDKAWYLANCMAFALPSLAEGFGAPVVEAMQFGKPIFLSALTSLPEIGGDTAFYFKHFEGEYMQQVFREGMLTYHENGLAEKIKERGRGFNWKDKVQEYLHVYRSMLQ